MRRLVTPLCLAEPSAPAHTDGWFASVIDADKIYVIESGKLVEEGTHLEFMSRDSLYKSIFNAQLRDTK